MNYFSDKETNCPCGCGATLSDYTLDRLNMLREKFNKPIYIEQGATCKEYSLSIGRNVTSTHIDNGSGALAVDIKSKTFNSKEDYFTFISHAVTVGFCGFGQGSKWIGFGNDKRLHIDTKRSDNGDFRIWVYM